MPRAAVGRRSGLAFGLGCALLLATTPSESRQPRGRRRLAGFPETMEGGLAAVLEQPREFARRLLHPHDLSGFYAEVWGRETHHFSRSETLPLHNADLVPAEPQSALRSFIAGCVSVMEGKRGEALQAHVDIRLLRPEHTQKNADYPSVPPAAIDEILEEGYPIVVNAMQFRWPAVAQLAEAMEAVFGHRTNISLHHTQGSLHHIPAALQYDENDVFVLQLSGSTVWAVHEPALPFARTDEKRRLAQELQGLGVLKDQTMSPGDMLYIPRGVPHTTRNLRNDAPSTHLTISLHVDLWQTIEGWLHRAVVHWLASETASNKKLLASIAQLASRNALILAGRSAFFGTLTMQCHCCEQEKWVPATAVTLPSFAAMMQADDAARAKMRAEQSKPLEAGTGAAAALLHAAVRFAANRLPAFRRAAVFAHTPLHEDWTAAVRTLCEKTPNSSNIVEAARSWDTGGNGLGSLEEFSTALKAAHLAIPPPNRPSGAAAARWDESALPFAGAVYAPETASEVHGRGVQTGIGWMIQTSPAPEGAWIVVWDSFCSAMQGSGGTHANQPIKDDGGNENLWQDLVSWHAEVRKRDRVRLTERYALNLEAASLPPLKSLQPLLTALKIPVVATHDDSSDRSDFIKGLPAGCGGRQSTNADIVDFFNEAAAGKRTRSEIQAQADWIMNDIELLCTPQIRMGVEVFERLINLTWQFLHDGARTLRATELWLALARPSGQATPPEQESLLRERIRVLHRYGNLTKRHGQEWPPPADGHTAWPAEGCGTFPGKTSAGANSRKRGHGGWQTTTAEATKRWGGEDHCTIRVLSVSEWENAAPECLAALFTRPFLVASGAEVIVNRSLFQRQAMLDVAAQSKLKISTLKDLSRNGFAYSDTRSPSFSTHIENMRRESENGEAHEYVFGPELLEQHHAELLRGLRLPSQFAGFINTQAPLLVNLALGGPGSGVFFHRHDAALNAVFYGTKRWMFYPDLPTSQRGTGADKKSFKRAAWLDPTADDSKSFAERRVEALRKEFAIDVCTQHAGDLVFVPGLWHHATLNLAETVAVAWRERFIESPLGTATQKWKHRKKNNGVVPLTDEDGKPLSRASMDHASLVFSL